MQPIDEDGELIGGLSGWNRGTCVGVAMLGIRESARRDGLGSRLLRTAEEAAVQRGCRQVVLLSSTSQAPGFYRRQGYAETGRRTQSLPNIGQADVHFVNHLA